MEVLYKEQSLLTNAICHLFEDIRYEINAIEIDRCKNVGLTSLMKGLISLNPYQNWIMENAGWLDVEETLNMCNDNGYVDVSIPLSMIMGFTDDYRKIVVNTKLELIPTRSRNDLNAVKHTAQQVDNAQIYEEFKIELNRVDWLMPYVVVADKHKIRLLGFIEKDRPITMSFHTWEFFEFPFLPTTSKHMWTVKTSNQYNPLVNRIVARKTQLTIRVIYPDEGDIRNLRNVK